MGWLNKVVGINENLICYSLNFWIFFFSKCPVVVFKLGVLNFCGFQWCFDIVMVSGTQRSGMPHCILLQSEILLWKVLRRTLWMTEFLWNEESQVNVMKISLHCRICLIYHIVYIIPAYCVAFRSSWAVKGRWFRCHTEPTAPQLWRWMSRQCCTTPPHSSANQPPGK